MYEKVLKILKYLYKYSVKKNKTVLHHRENLTFKMQKQKMYLEYQQWKYTFLKWINKIKNGIKNTYDTDTSNKILNILQTFSYIFLNIKLVYLYIIIIK